MTGTTKTTPWDVQNYLTSPERLASYLDAAFEDGDPALIAAALGDVARSKGMTEVASMTGVTREALYKALSAEGNPRLTTLMQVLAALGLRLAPVAIDKAA